MTESTSAVRIAPTVSPRPRRKLVGIAALLALLLVILAAWKLSHKPAPKASGSGPVPVTVETVSAQDTPQLARAVGTVTPLQNVSLRPQIDGVLAEVYFKEGQLVKAGQLLAKIDDRPFVARVAQARAEKASNVAQLVAAEAEYERYKSLAAKDLVAQQSVDELTARVAQLKAAIAANQAAIAAGEVTLSYARITSPVAGRVGIRKIDPGNVMRAAGTDALVTVTQLAPISVLFSLSQEHLPALSRLRDQATPAVVVAYAEDGVTELGRGVLAVIDNAVDSASGTIAMRAQFANEDGALWPGQFVTVTLETVVQGSALTVSPRAIRRSPQGDFVYRVVGGKAEMAPVTIGYEDEARAIVTKGVAAGDVVVTDGHSRLRPGAEVRIQSDQPSEGAAANAGGPK